MKLTPDEQQLVRSALFAYGEQLRANYITMRKLATSLRDGESHPMFAEGEDGARAADFIAENTTNLQDRVEQLQERLNDAYYG